jgi:DNA-directed RNA polymerase subunit RPC12/RpoP
VTPLNKFDAKITKFLDNDRTVTCTVCPADVRPPYMTYEKKHGYYICGNCGGIQAPNLIEIGKGPHKFFWTKCPDCGKSNLTELEQEEFFFIFDNGRLVAELNQSQSPINCTHCGKQFMKKQRKGD